ncbi:MAG: hypothetical protein RIS44_1520 [Pseudomonadota bacterium]|jgi:hypothetical protein
MSTMKPARLLLTTLAAAALLVACGGGGDDADHDSAVSIDTSGRLALTESKGKTLRIHDLDSNTVQATHALDNEPSGLYASPGGRYAVAVQRTQDLVQFVDGGVWQEDHVDHLHDYKEASKLVAFKLTGSKPTHYDVQEGKQAAFFMDGDGAANPVQNAGVRLITESSIASGQVVASLNLSFPIHGLGEPVDNKLLTVSRAADAPDTLPTHLNLYQRSGSGYTLDRQLTTRCDGMHGSYSSGSYTVAGCLDGVLLVKHTSSTAVTDQKVTTPLRVGTLAGHPKVPGQFIGIASEGVAPAPVTTRFYAINGDAASATELTPTGWTTGWTTGTVRRAHGFDRSGTRFYILDNAGTLIVFQRQGNAWVNAARISGAVPVMPTAAPWPVITANGARDEIYITDPAGQKLVVLNSSTNAITARRDLGYVPSNAVWLGIKR